MNLSPESVKKELEARFPDVRMRTIRDSILLENPQDLTRVILYLKEAPAFRMDYLSWMAASDFLDYLESAYYLYSIEKKTGPVMLRVRVQRTNGCIPSITPIFKAAELQEREAYDLYGIIYEGHPDLRRLFGWEGFEGYPLRKDYEQEDTDVLESADIEWLEARGIPVSAEVKAKAQALKDAGKRAVVEKPVEPRVV